MNIGMLQFALAKGIGDATIKKAISFLKENKCSWEELCNSYDLLSISIGLKDEVIENIDLSRPKAEELSNKLSKNNVEILIESEIDYPKFLKTMLREKCPPILFVKGNISLLNSAAVGFCGSRKVSAKGISITRECAYQLSKKGITVISGYAAGTDLAAHRAALESGGNTIFVLSEGILKAYEKKEIKSLLNDSNHVFVSQFMPELSWNAGNAMKRNSTIIGLSQSMILVESGKSGGTFAAGEESLKANCPLFVIDFAKPEVSAEANPYFISKGGIPIRGKQGIPNLSEVFKCVEQNTRQSQNNNYEYTQLKLEF